MTRIRGCMQSAVRKLSFFFLRFYLFVFRVRGRKREREGKKHQYMVANCMPPTGDLVHNPGMCPDWKLNWPLVHRPALNPLSHTSQGSFQELFKFLNNLGHFFKLPKSWVIKASQGREGVWLGKKLATVSGHWSFRPGLTM